MAKYSKADIDDLRARADIRDYIPGALRKANQTLNCPFCGEKKFNVVHTKGKNFANCWVCKESFPDAIAAVRHFSKCSFVEAVEKVAEQEGVLLVSEEEKRRNVVAEAKSKNKESFCHRQLQGSGLTEEDVLASVVDEKGNPMQIVPFQKGTIEPGFRQSKYGDDMVIHYYDLDGRSMTFATKGVAGQPRKYLRVRWSNPDFHADENGKSPKYMTPAGAPSMAYIPQVIRSIYQNGAPIDTLFIQEGEKKAEKACKHGMLSIGIQGINNFGTAQNGLLSEIQRVITRCNVKNVVLFMDSDWNDLHSNIVTGDAADKRPNIFSKVVIKFRDYMRSLGQLGIDANVYWGHVNENEHGDKGIDDLLVGMLKGRESELMGDVETAMQSINGVGEFVSMHKITVLSDRKIQDFWNLGDAQKFYELHKDRLASVETFKIGRIRYRVEDDKLVQVNRYSSTADIFSIETDTKNREKVVFNMTESLEFLKANGFFRLKSPDQDKSIYQFVRIEDGIIDNSSPVEIREFIFDYVKSTSKKFIVREFFANRLDSLLADKKLERMDFIEDDFFSVSESEQRLYYNNGAVNITAYDISAGQPLSNVWRSRILPRKFKRIPIFKIMDKDENGFIADLTEDGYRCDFMQYIMNTSNNYFKHDEPRELTEAEQREFVQHIVNKITSLGYLLTEWHSRVEQKVVVIQDHKMGTVGQSAGGVGKSILGEAIKRVTSQVYINGKNEDARRFLFERVKPSTRNVFIDDVRANFDFEGIFNFVTGDMILDRKNIGELVIPFEKAPKFLITTNHAINKADEDSFKRRIAYMEMSEWYSPEHAPIDDFHHMLFDGWDEYQWQLFDNLMAECVMYYLRSIAQSWYREGYGAVPPPMANIQLRTLRQGMSETFLQWAEEYFDPEGSHLNERTPKNDVIKSFFDFAGPTNKAVSRSNFLKRLQMFCRFKHYHFNVNKPNSEGVYFSDWHPKKPEDVFIGVNDKSGGVEYYTIWSDSKTPDSKPF